MGTYKQHHVRTTRIWTRVMREGMSIDCVSREFGLSRTRVERILFAMGKRRVAKEMSHSDTQQMRRRMVQSKAARRANAPSGD